jgi:cytochrome c oxidase assembly protein subunit 15
MKRHFPRIVKLTLISLYLLFVAGSIVRMTGSGMGCPDWPKCFGYLIPPTEESQLLWAPDHEYEKGVVIIKDEGLLVVQNDFKSSLKFEKENWTAYKKHDYAKFNLYHTWTEYINRLASVLSGFFFLFLVVVSTKFRKENKWIPILSFIAFILMLFEAWLGKTVVDTVLKPSIITVHMIVGLVIVAILLTLHHIVNKHLYNTKKRNTTFTNMLWVAAIFSLIQIALGTQVRQYVDEQVKLLGFENKQLSLMAPDLKFYIHRSFTIAIVLVNFWLFYQNEKLKLGYKKVNWILGLLGVEILSGILMYYVDFPIGTQAAHLVFGIFLFSVQFYLLLESKKVD